MFAPANISVMNANACKVIDDLGGTANVARLFRIRMPSVSKWREFGIPEARMMYLEVARPDVLKDIDRAAATSTTAEPTAA